MKKSVLWTAAGVVTATAIWASFSLPSPPLARTQQRLSATLNTTSSARVPQESYQVRILDQGRCLLSYSGSTPPGYLTWDGNNLSITSGDLRINRQQTGTNNELPVTLEFSFRKTKPGSSSAGICWSPIVLKPDSTIPIRL